MTLPAIGPVAASFSKSFCGMSSSWVFSTPVKFKISSKFKWFGLLAGEGNSYFTSVYVNMLH